MLLGYYSVCLLLFSPEVARCGMHSLFLFGFLLIATIAVAQTQKAPDVAEFVSVDAPVFVLNHVRVIDGSGAAAVDDQAVIVSGGKIQWIGAAGSAQAPA